MSKENGPRLKSTAIEAVTQLGYRPELDLYSRETIQVLKTKLQEQPNLSYIIYFNHIAYDDPLFAAYIANKINPENTPVIIPTSYSHTEPDNPDNKKFIAMVSMASWAGIQTPRVIQAYQLNNEKYDYTSEQAKETYFKFFKTIKQNKQEFGRVGVLISPEGTRSKTGELGKFEESFTKLVGMLSSKDAEEKGREDVVFIPLAIHYLKGYKREKPNFTKPVELSLGLPYFHKNGDPPPNPKLLKSYLFSRLIPSVKKD